MVSLLRILRKAGNNLRAQDLEKASRGWVAVCPSLRYHIIIPELLMQTFFNGFSLTTGKPSESHCGAPTPKTCCLPPCAGWYQFHLPAQSSPFGFFLSNFTACNCLLRNELFCSFFPSPIHPEITTVILQDHTEVSLLHSLP